ncbi:MAG: hypothetical protein KAG86_00510, partial [Gammaproteobacteria bacterium]|nr:hypothetical protein [Gammaproteobacteria bacterium]
ICGVQGRADYRNDDDDDDNDDDDDGDDAISSDDDDDDDDDAISSVVPYGRADYMCFFVFFFNILLKGL